MKNIYSYENMKISVDRLIKKKHGYGIDGIHVEQYAAFWDKNKTHICKELRTGRYVPQPVLQREKWKQSGKKREISQYTCTDCVILDAIKRAMTPILEKQFSEYSFGYREKKGTQTAVKQAAEYIESGKKYVLELDIKGIFDIRIGIVHATNERPDTLNLDIAEIFKPVIVDKTIFRMIHNRQIRAEKHFEVREEGGIYLNKEGKRIYITEMRNSLSRKITIDGEQISYYVVIRRELQKYCNYVDREIPYSPYKYSFK